MKLFEPLRIGALEIPNRIVYPPMGTELALPGGNVSDAMVRYYARRAAGGAGLVIVEYSAVDSQRFSSPGQLHISDDKFLPGLERLARGIKKHGAKAGIQLHHPGRQNYSRITGRQPIAPSAIPCPRIKEMPREMSVDEIHDLVEKFAQAALRAREAGFDIAQLHGAHGYMIAQFLSPLSNKRTDEYGGDTVRRARFAVEIIQRAKKLAGNDFPISLRLSADEHVPGGLVVEESCQIARLLVAAGADAIEVSAGTYASIEWVTQPRFLPRACLAPSAAPLKLVVNVPVGVAGRINDAAVAERVLQADQADFVGMGRALLADPDLPIKAKEGRTGMRCIGCNSCTDRSLWMLPVRCLVNPEAGVEEVAEERADVVRRVLVIGAEPAGMEAARVARLRGHDVTLWEERDKPQGRWAYLVGGFVKERLRELRDIGVRVELSRAITVASVLTEHAEVVLVVPHAKQRSVPWTTNFHGNVSVLTADQLLDGGLAFGQRLAVVGGGASGVEVAERALKAGSAVTLVSPTAKVGRGIESITRKALLDRLQARGLTIISPAGLLGLDGNSLVVGREDGSKTSVPVDSVIIASDYEPDDSLVVMLKAEGLDVRQLVRCDAPQKVLAAMEQGAAVARRL